MLEHGNDLQCDNFLPKQVFVRFEKTINIPGSSDLNISREEMGWFVPTGYRPLGLVGFEINSAQVIVRGIDPFHDPTANQPMIFLRNRSSSAYNNASVAVTYAFIENVLNYAKDTDHVFHAWRYFNLASDAIPTWSDWERDLPEGAGVLLTMENAGPVTNE